MNIFIIDDEVPIRQWIGYALGKMGYANQVCLFPSGDAVLEALKKSRPDLVFLDIKMPGISGIEILQKLKEQIPSCYVVMLTSYEDFNYIRKALIYGANEYILKTEIDEIVINEILERYQNSRKKSEGYVFKTYLDIENKISRLLKEKTVNESIVLKTLGIKSGPDDPYAIFTIEMSSELKFTGSVEKVQDYLRSRSSYSFIFRNGDGYVCILVDLGSQKLASKYNETINNYKTFFADAWLGKVGRSMPHYDFSELMNAIEESKRDLSVYFYGETMKEEPNTPMDSLKDVLHLKYCDAVHHIGSSNKKGVYLCITELLDFIRETRFPDVMYVKKIFNQLLKMMIEKTLKKIDTTGIEREIFSCNTFSNLEKIVMCELEIYAENRKKGYSYLVSEILDYIEHYFTKLNTLGDIASQCGVSVEHMCRVFKSETGMTCNTYVNMLRLKKAEELLTDTNLKISEIAELVGYGNISYFSRVFKDKYGMNPFSYRNEISKK
ncbi:response regulator [Christensenellaceae bacterium NSJ-63]|uniref:Stage 0 sporulation protein A homolog n=1 Tax=Guopingia tenuis TaxID=2763656 RepID=A0A926HT81_9FIRM|nr:response regulator [Guopingia tenuis]MBC8539222.1 response regulator [Guopingia tenuis]